MSKKEESPEYKAYKKYIRSKEWKEIAQLVLERDHYRCRFCGRTAEEAKLSVHHSTYENLFNEKDHLDDLITICQIDHICLHRNRNNWQRFKIQSSNNDDKQ